MIKFKFVAVMVLQLVLTHWCFGQCETNTKTETKTYPGLYGAIELTYLTGTGQLDFGVVNFNNESRTYGLRAIIGKNLSAEWGLGVGVGLDNYNTPSYNTMPIFIDARYRKDWFNKPWILGMKLGISPTTAGISGGIFAEPSISWRLKLTKKIRANFSFVMKVQRINDSKLMLFVLDPVTNMISSTRINEPVTINNFGFNLAFQL